MYIPVWFLFFFIPGAWAAFEAVFPLIIGLSLIGLVVIGIAWLGTLLERAAKALPACWLFDGSAGPPAAPAAPRPLINDDGPSPSDYHTIDGWNTAYKAWKAGKPLPFNAHNKSWRYGDDDY